ncbi:hypothetical protein CGLO_09534 [Colletotrichum gloeosporioides Cg-14]|uniref:Metallo-beta-lactamase domain-containing protein n=1 Tax=Colletotrichum gloeosporioides (strain Cg-14) TaxID=1237896 RepID=T0LHF3_COLGC|nr:hypothetical protein CGLO_09534 [Colletotrichum gloeosporioides Cg-14]
MSTSSGFEGKVSVTFIGTATAIIDIDGIKFLTDPFFSPAESFVQSPNVTLKVHENPALNLRDLPPIDAVLLSHEDHWDNLDELGRQLLDGRRVFTTQDGSRNLAPRPGVVGMTPWQTVSAKIGGKIFDITATPCDHVPGDECVGFVIRAESFGISSDGRPNAIYFSGDTVYVPELAQLATRFHIAAALMNVGEARVQIEAPPAPKRQITMGGKQASQLFRDIKSDWIIPMHFDSWDHFTQHGEDLRSEFEKEGVSEKVKWLVPGKAVRVL